MVNVLVIGSGGREHALSWKLSQSSKVETVYTAPGNGGTENNVPIDVTDLDGLADFAKNNDCFTVVGPEDPLAAGIVDKSGAWISYKGQRIGQGRENAKTFLREHTELAAEIEAAIRQNAGLVGDQMLDNSIASSEEAQVPVSPDLPDLPDTLTIPK